MKRLGIWFSLAACLLPAAGCDREEAPAEELIRPVRWERVFTTGGTRTRTFSGTAQAGTESQLSFKVGGTIAELSVAVGDRVKQGALIATIDPSDYQLRVQEAEAALAQAQAQLRNDQNRYDRIRALWENANASKQDLDGAKAAYESSEAQVRSIEKRLELAKLQVDYTSLRAPFDGAVAMVHVEQNENVSAGTHIIQLTSAGLPEVQVSVPEVLITQIQPGSPATVIFGALRTDSHPATVIEVGVSSTGFATTYPVTVCLDEAAPQVRPGMAAEVSFRFETTGTTEKVIVPPAAVGEDRGGRFVFVIEQSPGAEEGVAVVRRREVRVGDLTSEGLEILAGLQEGELVVTAGVSRIVDGQKVKLL
jgi:RND family efflux transporter MFP subunit